MHRDTRRLALLAIATFITLGWASNDASAQSTDQYATIVTGSQEVPPVATRAFSIGSFQFTPGDTAFVGIRVNFNHDQDVTDVHIHEAPAGFNGPIILNMRPTTPEEGICVDLFGGRITYYFLTEQALRGRLEGMTLTDLKAVMSTGDTYINLHTPENPGGWIRGQMRPREGSVALR